MMEQEQRRSNESYMVTWLHSHRKRAMRCGQCRKIEPFSSSASASSSSSFSSSTANKLREKEEDQEAEADCINATSASDSARGSIARPDRENNRAADSSPVHQLP